MKKIELTREDLRKTIEELLKEKGSLQASVPFYEYSATLNLTPELFKENKVELITPSGAYLTEDLTEYYMLALVRENLIKIIGN